MSGIVKSTKSYDIFKKHPSNGPIEPTNLVKVMRSIKTKNLLSMRPILVDKDMRVIDGQHRLEAAKKMDLPIFYTMNVEADDGDMILLNTQRTWGLENYLHYHVSKEKQDYIRFKKFMEAHNLTLRAAYKVLSSNDGGTGHDQFRKGNFHFPEGESLDEVNLLMDRISSIQSFIRAKTIGNNEVVKKSNFFAAIMVFLNAKRVDFDVFMKKLSLALDMFHPCTKTNSYLSMFRDIYNYRNKDPISDDELFERSAF